MIKRLGLLFLFAVALRPGLAWAGQPSEEASKYAQTHFLQGTLFERRGADVEALREYEKAFAFDPLSGYICRQAAELALETGRVDVAAQWVARLRVLEPANPETQILLGRSQWAAGNTQGAQAAFEAAIKLDPKSAESIFSLGSLLSSRNPGKARELFLKFIEQNTPHAAEGHFQIALLDQKAGRLPEAVKRLKQAIALDPSALPLRYAQAQIYEIQRDTDAALGQYLEILRLEPHNGALRDHVGQLYYIKGQVDEAKAQFKAAQAISPSDPAACQALAMLAEREGDYAGAAENLKASSGLAEDAALNLRLSYYLTQAGRLGEAVAVLEKAHQRWPSSDEVSYFLALGYDDLKHSDKAIALLRRVLELKPDYRDARYQLAVLLEKYGKIEEAEKEFRKLLANKPDDAGLLNYLGYSLADRGLKLDAAEEMIARAVRLEPKNGAYQDSLGWVYFKRGKFPEALKEFRGALEKLPDDPTLWDHMGRTQEALGDSPRAWQALKRAYALDPGNAKPARKAKSLQSQFRAEELGAYYMEYLGFVQGGLSKFSGLCEISGQILGQPFSYNGILTFRGNQLDIDLLGPLFTPLLRLRLGPDGFVMDPIHIEGIPPQIVTDSVFGAFSGLRDYLSAKIFTGAARYKKRLWRRPILEVAGWRLNLSEDGLRLVSLTGVGAASPRLDLGDFYTQRGRQVPLRLTVTGLGYSLGIKMQKASVEFLK